MERFLHLTVYWIAKRDTCINGMEFWLLALYFAAVILLIAVTLLLSYFLGQHHKDPSTDSPYESGIVSHGSARVRISVNYYLVGLLFVIFDLEAVYLFAWAVAGKDLGWHGFWGMAVFVGILLAVLVYEWRVGALDWGAKQRREVD